jgi:predicted dehydrogenase
LAQLALGVVGVGYLGSLHAKMLSDISDVKLAGVYDIDEQKARRIAGEFKTLPFPTLDALIASCDAVTIATPTTSHVDVARRAIESGKHVFIEKPVTESIAEAAVLCQLAQNKGVFIQVGHIERFNPAILALEDYEINPMFVESHRLAQFNPRGTDVAVVLDLMIHDIDIILSFVKSPVVHIEANGVAVVSDSIDIANARLQFVNGCVANVTASRISQRKMRKMRLFQRHEYISIDFSESQVEVFRLIEGGEEPQAKSTLMLGELGSGARKRRIVYEQPEVKEVNALKFELESFARSIRQSIPPVVSGEDGKRALEVSHDIIERINQQTVVL